MMALERIKPSVQLIDSWGSEDLVAGMTDVIYRGAPPSSRVPQERVERRIRSFLRDGHHSVLEFMGASWLLECSRACTHELIRHRVASYWQESQRYVDYGRGWFRVVAPPGLDVGDAGLSHYLSLERMGAPPEDARYALGNAVASRIWVQMNAREFFLAFLPLRTGLGAFHEIRLVAWLMFSAVAGRFPVTARWAWEHVTDHPDYCRGLKAEDRAECRSKSIIDAFTKWGVEVPSELTQFMGE
ncbi:thymidylate synthase [Thermocladium modestius]|uniref:Thymidylate synthase n=1 Tax=Thermocladium modestius TaxID=62609 RepID=A0A830GTJ5_9CREN|nr:FAD-dependent thymidylate synthase [Thermocladium modestius]GGP19111.1 thymidylate synthase [Thermocladium modestius]